MNKYKNLIIFTAIIVVITAFIPNNRMMPQDTTKTKTVVVDSTKATYEKIFKQQDEVNKSLDDILLERKQQQQKMDKKAIK